MSKAIFRKKHFRFKKKRVNIKHKKSILSYYHFFEKEIVLLLNKYPTLNDALCQVWYKLPPLGKEYGSSFEQLELRFLKRLVDIRSVVLETLLKLIKIFSWFFFISPWKNSNAFSGTNLLKYTSGKRGFCSKFDFLRFWRAFF